MSRNSRQPVLFRIRRTRSAGTASVASLASLCPRSSARALPAGVAAFGSNCGFRRFHLANARRILEEIFEETVRQAPSHGLVSGRVLLSDSTYVQVNANKNKFIRKAKSEKVSSYIGELE